MKRMSIAVIVPVLREFGRIRPLVAALASEPGVRVVVADGDPDAATLTALAGLDSVNESRCNLVASEAGRAVQMNAGARVALEGGADILLFLHADSELPSGWAREVRAVMARGFARCGAFSLGFANEGGGGPLYDAAMRRLTGWWAGLRSRLDRRPYGDQAQFFQASFFRELGGYAELPIMEDVEIMGRAVALGFPPCILPGRVRTSPRRYRVEGWLRRGGKNLLLRLRHALGADPWRLAKNYRPHGEKETDS